MSTATRDLPPWTASWPGALVRALSPDRWLASLVGVGALLLMGIALDRVARGQQAFTLDPWREEPVAQLGRALTPDDPRSALSWLGHLFLITVFLSPPCSILGTWISRKEIQAQHPGRVLEPGATALVRERVLSLLGLLYFIWVMLFIFLIPCLLAGVVSRLLGWGIGAVLATAALPVALACAGFFVLFAMTLLAYGLMPATVAVEGGDIWDGLSRSMAYLAQQPGRMLGGLALILTVSTVPLAGVELQVGRGTMAGPVQLITLARMAALALGMSLFWSLHTLLYLRLRQIVDGTPEYEVFSEADEAAGGDVRGERRALFAQPEAPLPGREGDGVPAAARQEDPTGPDGKIPEPTPEDLRPALPVLSLLGILDGRPPASIRELAHLMPVVVVSFLLLLVAREALWLLGGVPGGWGLLGRYSAVADLLLARPGLTLLVLLGSCVLGGWLLGNIVLGLGRQIVIRTVTGRAAAWPAMLQRARTPGRPWLALLMFLAGVQALLAAELSVAAALTGQASWPGAAVLGGGSLVLLALGAYGVAAWGVELERRAVAEVVGAAPALTLGALVLGMAHLIVCWLSVLLMVGAAWLVTVECVAQTGGGQASWILVGMGGRLLPETEGPLYWLAARIVLAWLAGVVVLLQCYPLAYVLHLGTGAFLLGRGRTGSAAAFELSLAEYRATRRQ